MARLSIRIDEIAALREIGDRKSPDPVKVAVAAEMYGANGITIRLGEKRYYSKERDLFLLKDLLNIGLMLEITPTESMIELALKAKPEIVNLIPVNQQALSEGMGLDLENEFDLITETSARLQLQDILVSLFIAPEIDQLKRAAKIKADYVELSTIPYAIADTAVKESEELERLSSISMAASKLQLGVMGGRGLRYDNIKAVAELGTFEEFIIGHSLMSRAVFVGLNQAIKDMENLIK